MAGPLFDGYHRQLVVTLVEEWMAALRGMVIRHPNPEVEVCVELSGENVPSLCVRCPGTRCTTTGLPLPNFVVSNVALTYFPGAALARIWLACAWVGYLQHEGLELVQYKGERPLDPHTPPFLYDRGLRQGFPVELTPETLRGTLEVVVSPEVADEIIRANSAL